MTDKEKFMCTIKKMWINKGRPEACWDSVHDWEYYWRVCGKDPDGAVACFKDAMECE